MITAEVDQQRAPVRVRAAVDPGSVGLLRMILGTRVRIGPPRPDGRIDVEARGHHEDAVAGELAGLGARLEVLEPVAVRDALARLGAELTATYAAAHVPEHH
jgi:hypothetical protein